MNASGQNYSEIDGGNVFEVSSAVHESRIRHELMKKMFTKPVEALFSADKVLYLEENGREGNVYCFVPSNQTPRNHLIVGRK